MKLTLTVLFSLLCLFLSGCHRSTYTGEDVDTQSMIDYQPPPMPAEPMERNSKPTARYWNKDPAASEEVSFDHGRSDEPKPAPASAPAVKSDFGSTVGGSG